MPAHYCDADIDYWKKIKARPQTPSVVLRRMTCQLDDSKMWVVDGRQTTRGHTANWLFMPVLGARFNISHARLPGNNALDICSSYGLSARVFLDTHQHVTIIEPQELIADATAANIKQWGLLDQVEIWCTRDWSAVNYADYNTIRFGVKELENVFHHYCDRITTVDNIVFDFKPNIITEELLHDQGYVKPLAYSGCHMFSRA